MSSDYTSHRRTSSRQKSLSSPLEQGPKFTPPTSRSRNASPVRKPLHDRSNSQTNQFAGPTIRIVEDPGSDIYSKYPVPSQASQILPPPRHAPGYGFERPGSRVSSGSQVASTIAKFEAGKAPVLQPPAPLQLGRKKKFRHSVSTSNSEADTLVASSYTPSSLRFSQGSTPPTSPPPSFIEFEKGLEILEEEAPHPAHRSTIRAVPPSSSGGESLDSRARALSPKASAASFASTLPAACPPPISNARNSAHVNGPLPKGHKHTPSSGSEKGQLAHPGDTSYQQPVLRPKTSEVSLAFSDISYTSIEPSHHIIASSQPSPTLHEARTATFASGARITYPLVRAASSNSYRAESSENVIVYPSRMQDRSLAHQWSSQLSTIPSISERDSRSIARGSRSYTRSQSQESYTGNGNGRSSYPRRRGHTVGSEQSSTDNVSSEGHTEFSAVPLPLFSPVSYSAAEEKDHEEEHFDTISPLPTSIPLRTKKSGYLRRQNSDASENPDSRPGSSQSDISTFIQQSIPAWARVYYRRGERVSMGAPASESTDSLRLPTSHSGRSNTPSDGGFPLSIYRPRNRPRHRGSQADTISLADEMQSSDGNVYVLGPNMQPLSNWSTPHLRTDRRGIRYSAWKAPSLDADLGSTLFGRQNRQVLFFCVGFLFPLAWIIASFLPLPLDPNLADAQSQTDLEQQFARNIGAIDDKAFQKATWWRNLNRVMSGIGTLLIGVIIALAVLVSRMS